MVSHFRSIDNLRFCQDTLAVAVVVASTSDVAERWAALKREPRKAPNETEVSMKTTLF